MTRNRQGWNIITTSNCDISVLADLFRHAGGLKKKQDFPSRLFCLTVPKISVGKSFTVGLPSGTEKVWIGGGTIKIFRRKFLTHSAEIFRKGTFYCFSNFMHKKEISLNSVENLLSQSADKIRRRTLLCFERILVSKIFKRRWGKLHGFVELFLSDRTENTSPGNHSMFQKIFGWEKKFMDKRGVSRFSV